MLAEYGWFAWIIIGLLAGAIAKLIMPGKDPGGWIVTILLALYAKRMTAAGVLR